MTMYTWLSMYKKTYTLVFFGVFTTILLFGALISSATAHPDVNPCIFDSSQDCMYGFSEHILEWQSTFFVSIKDSTQYLLFAIGLVLVYVSLVPQVYVDAKELYIRKVLIRYRQCCDKSQWSLFVYLFILLQRGILHPKLF